MGIINMRYPAILRSLSVICLLFWAASTQAQDHQTNFTFGKELFREGRYELAMQSFKKVMMPAPNNPYAPYAAFYNALSAYKLGQSENSRSLFLELTQRFPDWEKLDEAYYWVATGYFEQNQPAAALDYLKRVKSPSMSSEINLLKTKYISKIDSLNQLKALYNVYDRDTVVASRLARKIVSDPGNTLDQAMVREIVEKFDLPVESFGLVDLSKSVKKNEYHVAVMLPFMFSSLDESKANPRADFVTELYTGILLAAEKLNAENKKVTIHAYDTRRSGAVTTKLLQKAELKRMDLIIGPLYPEPSKLVSDFSFANKINMINPVSANPDVMAGNPFSFLLRPTYLTQSLKAAEYAIEKFQDNKNALVFYEYKPNDNRDSLAAVLYAQQLRDNEFNVLKVKPLRSNEAHYLIDTLSFKKEVEIKSKERLDSMLLKPDKYIVKSKQKTFGKDSLVYIEEVWSIKRDSIGHIMIASSNPLFATNTISAIEIRPDKIPVIGREDWLDIPQVNYDQVERINAVFISPVFIDKSRTTYQSFSGNYMRKYKAPPSVYASLGYEMTIVFGGLMHANGNYFQAGLPEGEIVEGVFTSGFEYGFHNDNQVVTFLKLENNQLVKEVK
ncbi:MAG: tetratricopeptide repeat protein [Imperialibacter sp.]|uniref:ABC transporter substrate-binding protein n=1 Tax=Imperialibacter sp. TaxID=2038411 RepID=UPI0032EF319E